MKHRGIELMESLFSHHQSAVVADLEQMGKEGWIDWLNDNRLKCFDYLEATPSIRKKKKWTNDTQNHHRLILGALVFHRVAMRFQAMWEAHGDCMGHSYRAVHKSAALDGWNAMVILMNLSIYPLDFLDELLCQSDEDYEEDLTWIYRHGAPDASFD
jgi:hypothetical protein